jgi:hypothetical protein
MASMNSVNADTWTTDWIWSLPLILSNIVIHVFGLALINDTVVLVLKDVGEPRRFMLRFAEVMGGAVLLIIILHTIEAITWAAAYWMLGALPDYKTAMLYSLSAMTGYGHANVFLHPQWQMMGVLQSLNGVLLFGLTTAFLFAMIQSVWPAHRGHAR